MNGPTKSRVLAGCANSLEPIKYLTNTGFLSKHDVNVKRYWDNIVPITASLLGPCKWTVDDQILAFLWLGNTFLYFIEMLHLFCITLFSPPEIIFTNDEHVFLRILATNLWVLCFDIYAIPTMFTPFNHASEICLVNIFTFSAWGVTVKF